MQYVVCIDNACIDRGYFVSVNGMKYTELLFTMIFRCGTHHIKSSQLCRLLLFVDTTSWICFLSYHVHAKDTKEFSLFFSNKKCAENNSKSTFD